MARLGGTLPVETGAEETGTRRYAARVTPEQLSATIVAVLTRVTARARSACRTEPRRRDRGAAPPEGARRLRHQRGAAAGQEAGMNPRAFAELVRRGCATPTGSPTSRSPGRGSSTSRSRPAPRAPSPPRSWRGWRLRPHRDLGRRADQRRVHLRQPDRPAPPRAHPVGDRGRRHRPGARGGRRRGDPRVLHQRPRQPDEPLRRVDPGGCARRGRRPRTATTAVTSPSSPSRSWPSSRRSSTCLTTSADRFREAGTPSSWPSSKQPWPGIQTHFDVWFSERSLHESERRRRASRSCASRATPSTPTARSGCAPPTSATTRTGC